MIRRLLPCFAFSTLLLTGCAMNSPLTGSQNVAADDTMSGSVHGGQQPVINATVTLYAAATGNYGSNANILATTTSNANGQFRFPAFQCPSADRPTYVLALGGSPQVSGTTANPNIALGAALGPCSSALSQNIAINEVTTAVMAVTMGQFYTTQLGASSNDTFGTSPTNVAGLANAMSISAPLLVNLATGQVNTTNTQNGVTTTIESAKINTIANVIASCVNTTGTGGTSTNCSQLFSYTTPPNGTAPSDTLQAAVQMELYPYQNVTNLYNLSAGAGAPFQGLSSAPTDWTVGVSFSSKAFTLGIYGAGNTAQTTTSLDIDANGDIWFPTNSSTSHGLAFFGVRGSVFVGPFATQLTHPQYVAIDTQGLVWGSDLAAAQIASVQANNTGNTQTYTTTGHTGAISIDSGSTTQDAVLYADGGSAGMPGASLYQILGGQTSPVYTYSQPAQSLLAYGNSPVSSQQVDAGTSNASSACNYETDQGSGSPQGITASTSSTPCYIGGIAPSAVGNDDVITTSTNQLCNGGTNGTGACFASPITLTTPKNIALDGLSSLWIANSGNSSISTLGNYIPNNGSRYTHTSADYVATSTTQYAHGTNNGGTLTTPYGLVIDISGNVWISNATCVTTPGVDCPTPGFTLSELIGAAAPTITPLAAQNIDFDFGNPGYASRP